MRSGVCPKCGSTKIHESKGAAYRHRCYALPVSVWSLAWRDHYVCADCGYVESYVRDRKEIDKIVRKWPALEPQQRV